MTELIHKQTTNWDFKEKKLREKLENNYKVIKAELE